MASPMPEPSPTSRTSITFPRRQWVTRDNCLTLALTATAQLVWPPSTTPPNVFFAKTVPAARVAQLVRAGRLWIGMEGRRVQLGVTATLGGKSCIQSEQLAKLRELIVGWPWRELGLVVHYDRGEQQDDLRFSHPPSPSGLYVPRGIPHARLERVDCQLRFNCCLGGFDLPFPVTPMTAGQAKKSKKTKKTKPKPQSLKAKKRLAQAQALTDPNCLFNVDNECWERTCIIVGTALATFVGIQGRQVGARALDRQSLPSGAPSLLDVAPAVWSYHLFKAAASRATYVPLVHRALSAFANAQSPGLRRKAEALTQASSTADQSSGQEGGLAQSLEELLLKHTLFEPQRLKRQARSGGQALLTVLSKPCPEPTTAYPSQEQQQEEEELFHTEESQFYDIDMNSLDHAFDLSQHSTDDSARDAYTESASEAGDAVDWDDVEAWTEHDSEWLDHGDGIDGRLEEGYCSWSPVGYGGEGEPQGGAAWLDVEDEQLEAALSTFESRRRGPGSSYCEEDQFMDIDEMGLFTMGMEDEDEADEGICMWRNEHDMIEQIL